MCDVGLIATGFNLSKFELYPSRDIPEDWNKHIDNYKSEYSISDDK